MEIPNVRILSAVIDLVDLVFETRLFLKSTCKNEGNPHFSAHQISDKMVDILSVCLKAVLNVVVLYHSFSIANRFSSKSACEAVDESVLSMAVRRGQKIENVEKRCKILWNAPNPLAASRCVAYVANEMALANYNPVPLSFYFDFKT